MTRLRMLCLVLAATVANCVLTVDGRADIKAGAAERDITLPVGLEIQHYFRKSIGVHDPLFARCLYLEDDAGSSVAIICLDLILGAFDTCDSLRAEIREHTGIENSLINFSHSHSSAALGPRRLTRVSNDEGSRWNDATLDAIIAIVKEAKERAEPVSLRAGRAASHVGFNRRLLNKETGHVYMGVNREGPLVPWVNVLVADSKKSGKPLAVLLETAGHPVIVPHTSKLTSADYPGAAVQRIREVLGEDIIAIFGQGCAGDINGFPLRSKHENAESQGRDLGNSVLEAIKKSVPVEAAAFHVKFARASLPSRPFPSEKGWQAMVAENKDDERRMSQLTKMRALMDRGEKPPPRRFDAYAVSFGREWCLTTMPHEMFCEYELWIDKNAPFEHTMTFAYTNGYEGYIAVDSAWRLGFKGGYEAACLPNWGGQVWTKHFGPPAVGSEKIIKDTLASLWPKESARAKPADSKDSANRVQPAADAPQPMTPEESATKMHLPKGFRIELVASEPAVQDPSGIAFDERGRLFVCELHGYNIEGHLDVAKLNTTGVLDRKVRRIRWELKGGRIAEEAAKLQYGVVKLLTDTDGDGVMDKADVWAKDLPPSYGVVPARGGVIVVSAPDIVFLADRDGDGKPEVRETLFTGFRIRVLERGINNPRWGLDNWIYVGSGDGGGTIRGPRLARPVELPSSDFRIKADGSAIEPVNGSVGTFGMTMNSVGDRFPASGGQPATYALPLPYRYLARNPYVATPRTNHAAANYGRGFRVSQPHPWRVRRRKDPAWVKFYGNRETDSNYFTGGCSNEYYGDELFPEEYRGCMFYCEPSLNIVHRTVVKRDGAGYRAHRAAAEERSEFLASEDQWFRPMNLRVGPEGALYIVDMYREIIEDYSAIPRFLQQQYGLDKGNDRGRIWRLVPETAAERPSADLSKLSAAELVRATGDSRAWRRLTAQRLLVEHGDGSVADALSARIGAGATPRACIHALYTLDGLGKLRPADVACALDHENYGVRLHALRLADRFLADEALIAKVAGMTGDADSSVRLQLAMTLGESRDAKADEALLTLARQHGSERWMSAAILSSSKDNAGRLLLHLLSRAELSQDERALLTPLATTLGGQRDGPHVSRVLTDVATLDETIQEACLRGLVDGLSRGKELAPESTRGWAPLASLLRSKSSRVRDLATQLATRLSVADSDQLTRMFREAVETVFADEGTVDERLEAVQLLSSAPYDTLAPAATKLLDAKQPPALQHAAVASLGASGDERVGRALLEKWPALTPATRAAVVKTILSRENRLPALLDAIERKVVRRGDLSAIQREQLTTSRDEKLTARAKKLFANPTAGAELEKRMDRYQKALAGKRNLERGKQVFTETCATCHKLKDEGLDVGPPLGSVINRPDEAILLDLLDPSGHIESEYASYIVVTEKGLTFTGILASESPTSVTLRKEKGAEDVILRKDIAIMTASEVSLMPSNLDEKIGPEDAAHLIAFLRQAFASQQGAR